jgi:hypothetical protein
MFRIFEVNYDLRAQPKPNYTGLYEELKKFPGWCQVLESMWFIYTDLEAVEVYNQICRFLHRADRTWVNEVGTEYYGWLTKEAWNWLGKARQRAITDNSGLVHAY